MDGKPRVGLSTRSGRLLKKYRTDGVEALRLTIIMARRLMAGHRSLAPAVMVRIHPGQLCGDWVSTLVAVVLACGMPFGLSGAPAPSTLAAPLASALL